MASTTQEPQTNLGTGPGRRRGLSKQLLFIGLGASVGAVLLVAAMLWLVFTQVQGSARDAEDIATRDIARLLAASCQAAVAIGEADMVTSTLAELAPILDDVMFAEVRGPNSALVGRRWERGGGVNHARALVAEVDIHGADSRTTIARLHLGRDPARLDSLLGSLARTFWILVGVALVIMLVGAAGLGRFVKRALGVTASGLHAASAELVVAANALEESASQTVSRVRESGQAGGEVVTHIQSVSAAMTELVAAVGEVARNATEAATVARDASDTAEAARSAIVQLEEQSSSINGVLHVISQVSEQTKLCVRSYYDSFPLALIFWSKRSC